ncbi:MAG: TIM barrel protein [Pyrinomonadaceae bacterium]
MNTQPLQTGGSAGSESPSRRKFLGSVSAAVIAAAQFRAEAFGVGGKTFGIAYTSFPVRMRQAASATASRAPAIPAEAFIDLCHSFGAAGCQMDFAQLRSTEPDYLKSVRAALARHEMFLELSVGGKVLDDQEELGRVASAARQLGVSRLRVALLSGRRYENFTNMAKWKDFVNHWKHTLRQVEPALKRHQLRVGIENHKDWLADELAEMLGRLSSRYLGACVDFGNNLALLEDSLEVARKLAPYVVTTHLKDMALAPYDRGCELSEVPLGDGFLPLARIIEILRGRQPDVPFCLEMITRDPLKIPYRDDAYWVTYERRDRRRVSKFETSLLSQAQDLPLPRISHLAGDRMQAVEDDNIRRSAHYARQTLNL